MCVSLLAVIGASVKKHWYKQLKPCIRYQLHLVAHEIGCS